MNCLVGTCNNGKVTYNPTQCPPKKPVVCTNNFPAIEVFDDNECCSHYECQCKSTLLNWCCLVSKCLSNHTFSHCLCCLCFAFFWPNIKVSAMAGETPIMWLSMEHTMDFKATVPTGWWKRYCLNSILALWLITTTVVQLMACPVQSLSQSSTIASRSLLHRRMSMALSQTR